MLGLAAGLPDALVGFAPHLGGALGLRLDDRPQPPRQPLAAAGVQQDRVQDGAEHVVLALVERSVADPHRSGTRVAGQVVAGGLGQVAPAVDPVHDLQRAVSVGSRSATNCMNSSASQSRFRKCSACNVKVVSRIQV